MKTKFSAQRSGTSLFHCYPKQTFRFKDENEQAVIALMFVEDLLEVEEFLLSRTER